MLRGKVPAMFRLLLLLPASAITIFGATPFIAALTPASLTPGLGPVALTISGANFASGAVVNFGSRTLHPDSIAPGRIGVMVPPEGLGATGTFNVTVVNPGTEGKATTSNTLAFEIGYPPQTLSFRVASTPLYSPAAVVTGDFNGDGKLDLAIANSCAPNGPPCPGNVIVQLGDGLGGFATSYSIGTQILAGNEAIATADFNGDGRLDLVVSTTNTLTVLLGNGGGGFQPVSIAPPNPAGFRSVIAADFNGDGNPDIAVLGGPGILVFPGDGNGGFAPGLVTGLFLSGSGFTAGDFNNDGRLDLVVSTNLPERGGQFGFNYFLAGNGSGGFSVSTFPQPVPYGAAMRTVDLNGDGNQDVIMVATDVVVALLGDGTGQFASVGAGGTTPFGFNTPIGVGVADFNGDRIPDLAILWDGGQLTISLGDGLGRFIPPQTFSITLPPGRYPAGDFNLTLGDFNGDGQTDFAVAITASNQLEVLIQDTAPPLATQYSIMDICFPRSCDARVLGDSGLAAGIDFAAGPGNYYEQQSGTSFYPYSINKSNIIAGTLGTDAGVWAPLTGVLVNLDTVFGWPSGIATSINDHNEAVGYSPGIPVIGLVPNQSLDTVAGISNNGVVVGQSNAAGVVFYGPGVGTRIEPLMIPVIHNEAGQVLLTAPSLGLIGSVAGFSGQPTMPGFFVTGFNDTGQFLMYDRDHVPYIYSASRGPSLLQDLIAPGSNWTLTMGRAINDGGQILVQGANGGRSTSLLLTPTLPLAPHSIAPRAIPPGRAAKNCLPVTINSRGACRDGHQGLEPVNR